MPKELRLSTTLTNDSVFVIFPDDGWFLKIMESKNDGVALDLVQKQQFQCDNISRFAGTWSHKGFLLPPLYRDELMKRKIIRSDGYVFIPVGKLPRGIRKEDAEANYILIDNKNVCAYTAIVNIDFHGWKLLESGLYYDTLSADKMQEKYKELSKRLHFTIPFEKNKSTYNPRDLKPMYDSLRMTDFAIRTISIKAFTSVEGTYERNEQLQRERAQSIVSALQTFQSEKIESTITTSENWVEFLDDVVPVHRDWLALSKDEIKEKLKSPALLDQLEPVLRTHRKGIIEITLEKRLSYRESNPVELKKYFQQTLAERNMDEALYLQQIIFNKVERHELPDQYVHELEVPESLPCGSLLINQASFDFDHGFTTVIEAIAIFNKLDHLLPDNALVQYNLCALKLRAWVATELVAERPALKDEIQGLLKKGIHPTLVKRLMMNYYIILSEKFDRQHKFADKDQALKFILNTYKSVPMTDDDLLNLAKYFSHYSRFDWAERVIEPRIKAIDVSEDLVFYYLSLTIFETKHTREPAYRTTMLNAINGNRQRFCELFNTSGEGGISFQLLQDQYLKKTFCENCK